MFALVYVYNALETGANGVSIAPYVAGPICSVVLSRDTVYKWACHIIQRKDWLLPKVSM